MAAPSKYDTLRAMREARYEPSQLLQPVTPNEPEALPTVTSVTSCYASDGPVTVWSEPESAAAMRQRRHRARKRAGGDIWSDFHETVAADG
jgi:hypothetical protein